MERTLGYGDYKPLLDRFVAILHGTLGHNLVSLVLYGSVARGTAGPQSDIDLLLIQEGALPSYARRLQAISPALRQLRGEPVFRRLEARGISPALSVIVLSPAEAQQNRHVYLDMIEDARLLVDRDGFFQRRLDVLKARLRDLGSKKVRRGASWYWDLKPDLRPDEAIAL